MGEEGVMPGLVEADAENWGSGLSKQSCQSYYMLLSQWLNQHQFELLNEPDISTFYRQNMRNISIIDLAFAIKALNQSKSIFW